MSTVPTPREFPLAASKEEVFRGAGWAWLAFVVLMLVALTVMSLVNALLVGVQYGAAAMASLSILPLVLGYALLIGGGVSFLVMLAGLPVVWLVARALRDVISMRIHAAVYAALGALIGVIAIVVFVAMTDADPRIVVDSVLAPITVAISAVAVFYGWWRASRHARRALREARSALSA